MFIMVMVVLVFIMVMVVLMLVMVMVVLMFVMVMVVLMLIMVMVVLVFVMVMVVVLVFIMVMMMMLMVVVSSFFQQLFQFIVKSVFLSHSVNELLACKLVPLCSNDRSSRVLLAETLHAVVELILRKTACVAEYKAACIGYLIIEELAEVLHVHLVLLSVNNSCEAVKLNIVSVNILNSADNVAELANARRLDKDTVRSVISKYLFESLAEVSHETATDTA